MSADITLRSTALYFKHSYQGSSSHSPISLSRDDFQTHILLINRSLLMGLPFFPPANRGVSVHISLTFSNTMLQCRSKALTRASSLRLLRHDISTWVCERTAVCRMDSGPEVNSCCSSCAISNSLRAHKICQQGPHVFLCVKTRSGLEGLHFPGVN